MTERPILFSGPMVRALLDGRKTQTRRIVKPQPRRDRPDSEYWIWESSQLDAGYCHTSRPAMERIMVTRSPYGVPGDRLWVRETFKITEGAPRRAGEAPVEYIYRADQDYALDGYRWKPAIHMPRAACRLVLDVVYVRVERLQEISEDDAFDEGCFALGDASCTARYQFECLWESLNARRAPWSSNPWVWVIEFKKRSER